MPKWIVAALCLLIAAPALAAESWVVATDLWGNRQYQTLTLEGDHRAGGQIEFEVAGSDGPAARFVGRIEGDAMSGAVETRASGGATASHPFTSRRIPDRPAGGPRTVDFDPTDFSNLFSADRAPVLHIWPSDTVHTRTIDSGGVDEHGQRVALYGNPQTGPFFVVGARPGDTLSVRLLRLRPNRDYADSLDAIVARAQSRGITMRAESLGRNMRWHLDAARRVATPEGDYPHLRDYSVPLRPMLGGIAVAPGFGWAAPSTGDTGPWGGNIDFNEIAEGATVYLPVQQPGALLYIGDAHAAQGDGETSQFALETSMDVTFRVDLIHGRRIAGPRVETAEEIIAIGQAGTMEDATRQATFGLVRWLTQDYGLDLAESALLLGSAVRYSIVTLAGQNVGIAARFPKARLAPLAPAPR
jgi:amidase